MYGRGGGENVWQGWEKRRMRVCGEVVSHALWVHVSRVRFLANPGKHLASLQRFSFFCLKKILKLDYYSR